MVENIAVAAAASTNEDEGSREGERRFYERPSGFITVMSANGKPSLLLRKAKAPPAIL